MKCGGFVQLAEFWRLMVQGQEALLVPCMGGMMAEGRSM